ncbi:hypothetical protein [Agrococcus sp. DT81.2]|uniref:hypothetical protein n=1 Tax=Agrococcus sp. DT81.2 TaxID=3393414 RepID=UPI003CE57C3B
MLRSLALPAALVTVLAASACASASDVPRTVTDATPSTSTSTSPPTSATPTPTESADEGTTEPRESTDAPDSTEAALEGDPGVPGLPQSSGASVDDVLRLGAIASWTERPDLIALSLPASSSCWALAAEPMLESPTTIVVEVAAPEPCETLDAARTYSISVPDGTDTSGELQLQVVGPEHEFTLTLPAE